MNDTEAQNTTSETVSTAPKKRGRKPGKKRKGYFYEEEEEAFVRYLTTSDQKEKDRIFSRKLLPAFTKMIESIIRRYGLFTPSEDFTDTFYDTLSFLMTKVDNYDPTKGYKAYSFCGTICKNYLIMKRNKFMKMRDKYYSYDEVYVEPKKDMIQESDAFSWNLNTELINEMIDKLQIMLDDTNITRLTIKEQRVGYALLEILMNWEELMNKGGSDKFNKTSILYFIKEYTLLSTTDVRESSKIYRRLYYDLKQKLLKE